MKRFIIILLTIIMATGINVQAQRTTRRHLTVGQPAKAVTHVTLDTITPIDSTAIRYAGYEKTLKSSVESFFVTNYTDCHIDSLQIELTYKDMDGRILDSRQTGVKLNLPSYSTRRIDLRTWDRQHTFYYYLSPKPRVEKATPYKVSITTLAAFNHISQ